MSGNKYMSPEDFADTIRNSICSLRDGFTNLIAKEQKFIKSKKPISKERRKSIIAEFNEQFKYLKEGCKRISNSIFSANDIYSYEILMPLLENLKAVENNEMKKASDALVCAKTKDNSFSKSIAIILCTGIALTSAGCTIADYIAVQPSTGFEDYNDYFSNTHDNVSDLISENAKGKFSEFENKILRYKQLQSKESTLNDSEKEEFNLIKNYLKENYSVLENFFLMHVKLKIGEAYGIPSDEILKSVKTSKFISSTDVSIEYDDTVDYLFNLNIFIDKLESYTHKNFLPTELKNAISSIVDLQRLKNHDTIDCKKDIAKIYDTFLDFLSSEFELNQDGELVLSKAKDLEKSIEEDDENVLG